MKTLVVYIYIYTFLYVFIRFAYGLHTACIRSWFEEYTVVSTKYGRGSKNIRSFPEIYGRIRSYTISQINCLICIVHDVIFELHHNWQKYGRLRKDHIFMVVWKIYGRLKKQPKKSGRFRLQDGLIILQFSFFHYYVTCPPGIIT